MFNPANVPVQPIASLTPFLGGKPWLKVRVVDKAPIRTWNKPTSSGKLFSCTFVDESASIRATFFNEGVDAFEQMLENGKVFYVCGGSVKNANRRFNNVNNEYEMSMDKDAQIHAAGDAATNIPTQRYNFVPVVGLAQKEENSPVDLLVVVTKVGDIGKIVTKKDQTELTKREVSVADASASVDATFWNDEAMTFGHAVGSVLALKNVKVKHFRGVAITITRESTIEPSPAIPDTENLRKWYSSTGGKSATALSNQAGAEGNTNSLGRRYFRQIESENLGKGEKPDYIQVRCMPTFIKTDSIWYDGCPTCNKKVSNVAGDLRCEKCNKTLSAATARYMCTIQASDGVTTKWITMFGDSAETFWGCKADDLKSETAADPQALTRRAQARLYKPMLLNVRVKEESGGMGQDGQQYGDRTRLTGTRIEDFLFPAEGKIGEECNKLIETIMAYRI